MRASRARSGGGPGVDLIVAQASILIVNDKPLNCMLQSCNVERQGYLVATVGDAGRWRRLEPNHSTSSCSTSHAGNGRLRDPSKCPEPDARLLTPYVKLTHIDEVARRAQEGLASRIRNEN